MLLQWRDDLSLMSKLIHSVVYFGTPEETYDTREVTDTLDKIILEMGVVITKDRLNDPDLTKVSEN